MMNNGFDESPTPKITLNKEELNKLIKKYKKIKKYTKSSIFEIKQMDNTETYVSKLIEEATQDPPVL